MNLVNLLFDPVDFLLQLLDSLKIKLFLFFELVITLGFKILYFRNQNWSVIIKMGV